MLPKEFLTALWPEQGLYCVATPFKIPNTDVVTYAHKIYETIDSAAQFIESNKRKYDIFFCIHTLKERQVWNSTKINKRTGEIGAFEVRTHKNTQAARCLFFDLDVDAVKDRCYPTQRDALAGLLAFCKAAQMPKPLVTSSGGGLHVYWPLQESLPSDTWRNYAQKLKSLANYHGLKVDPSRTTDQSSVLRVAGTYNLKDKSNPRPVQVLMQGAAHEVTAFDKLLDDALIRAGITVNFSAQRYMPVEESILGSNTEIVYDGPPVSAKALILSCAQMQRIARLKGDVSEPEWYQAINLIRFTEDGRKHAHTLSKGHPKYNHEDTEAKLDQLESKDIKPTSCNKLAEVCGDELCNGCKSHGKVKSPIVAARYKDKAPAPVIQLQTPAGVPDTFTLPDPPYPFVRLNAGGIGMTLTNKENDTWTDVIYPYDLYPVRRVVNIAHETEQQVWCVVLPRIGATEFVLTADALYDNKKFASVISNKGIYPADDHLKNVRAYMIAYITLLQKLKDADLQSNHLGWDNDYSQFILPEKIICKDGTVKKSTLGVGATRSSEQVYKKGTLARQVELMNFYNHPEYIPHQFFILCGLAAPLFFATGQHGVIVNASGESGASKSTALYTASAFWGHPSMYPINGTNQGATVKGRFERIAVMANLPICVDEITHIPCKEAQDLVMSVTQPAPRLRLGVDGVERKAIGGAKATIMMATANSSLHGILSVDNAAGTAGSMRVLEIQLDRRNLPHKKYEADDYLQELHQNFGHIGEAYMQHVTPRLTEMDERIRLQMRQLDLSVDAQPSERFWTAVSAVVLSTGEIAKELGLLPFDVEPIKHWLTHQQIPSMRGVVVEQYSNPLGILTEYLELIHGDTLIASKPSHHNNIGNVIKAPQRQMLAHFDNGDRKMWVLKKGFKDYCIKAGANFNKIMDDLSATRLDGHGRPSRIIPIANIRKVLGAGTEFAKSQSWCFMIDMTHPEISGVADLVLAPAVPVAAPSSTIKMVQK